MKKCFSVKLIVCMLLFSTGGLSKAACQLNTQGDNFLNSRKTIIENHFIGKAPVTNPQFIITYGPPGSGKSTIVKHYCEKFNISSDTLITVNVDDIIRSMPCYEFYRHKIKTLSNRLTLNEALTKLKREGEVFNLITKNLPITESVLTLDEFKKKLRQKLYFFYRKQLNADAIATDIREKATLGNYNLVWETTGRKVAWTVKVIREMTKHGYSIKVLYPFVTVEESINRVSAREKKTRQEGARREIIKESSIKAQSNLKYLLPMIDEFILYDNTAAKDDINIMFKMAIEYTWTPELKGRWLNGGYYVVSPGIKFKPLCNCDSINKLKSHFSSELESLTAKLCTACNEPTPKRPSLTHQ